MSAQETLAEGYAWYATLHQQGPDARWKPEHGEMTTLAAMDPGHRSNLLAWLRRRHRRLVSIAYWGAPQYYRAFGDAANDAVDQILDDEADRMLNEPTEWFEATPFLTTLREMVEADEACLVASLPGSGRNRRSDTA